MSGATNWANMTEIDANLLSLHRSSMDLARRVLIGVLCILGLAAAASDLRLLKVKSFVEVKELAVNGDADAQCELGLRYHEGRGIMKDQSEAMKWWLKSAEQGFAEAQYSVATAFSTGDGVPVDKPRAARLFLRAAEQGHPQAQVKLGRAYCAGDGVEKDEHAAYEWFRKAADKGSAEGQLAVGTCYAEGRGVTKNWDQAVRFIEMSANQGLPQGQHLLGRFYLKGLAVARNQTKGMELQLKAAGQGYWPAQLDVAFDLVRRRATTEDLIEAYKWFIAAEVQQSAAKLQGEQVADVMYSKAAKVKDALNEMLTQEQISEAKRRAQVFSDALKKASGN